MNESFDSAGERKLNKHSIDGLAAEDSAIDYIDEEEEEEEEDFGQGTRLSRLFTCEESDPTRLPTSKND